MIDPYAVLGVAKDADADAIKKAYKKLARKYHPDVSKEPDADRRFKEVNEAFDVLKDPEKKLQYDTWRTMGSAQSHAGRRPGPQGARSPSGFSVNFDDAGGVDLDDMLSSIFGAGASAKRGRKGQDHKARLDLSAALSFSGGETSVTVTRPGGEEEVIRVRVPPGVTDGGSLRLRGRGGRGQGNAVAGDLILDLHIAPHPLFRRRERDLELDLPITLGEAARGATVEVPTPTGEVTVKIPPRAVDGQRLRLRGKGVQYKEQPGDLYLILRVRMPQQLDEAALSAIDVLEERYEGSVRQDLKL